MIKGKYFNASQYTFPRFFTTICLLNISLRLRRNKKIGPKSSALKVALSKNFDELVLFGQMDIDEEVFTLAQKFLVCCIYKDKTSIHSTSFVTWFTT